MFVARRAAQFGFLVTASQVLPRRFGGQCAALEPETLLGKEQAIGVGVRERESVVVPARRGAQRDFGLDPCRGLCAAVELIVGAAVYLDELSEASRSEHPAQHLEETDEVRLPRAVGADKHRGRWKVRQFDLGKGTEALDSDALQLDSIRQGGSSAVPVASASGTYSNP